MFSSRLRINQFIVKKHPLFQTNGISIRRKRNKRGREPILLDSGLSSPGLVLLDPFCDSDLICDCQSLHANLREHSVLP